MLFACAFGLCMPKWAYNTMTLASLILDTPLYSCSSIDNVTMEVESWVGKPCPPTSQVALMKNMNYPEGSKKWTVTSI